MRFPYPPGDYRPDTVVGRPQGGTRTVAGDPRLETWLTERGVDWNDVYRVRAHRRFAWVYRFANNRHGKKYVRWLRLHPNQAVVARRIPKLVRA